MLILAHADGFWIDLHQLGQRVLQSARGPVVFVDLHTSSADGPPFLCLADTIDNRRLGLATGVPIILGIEETIDGASLEFFSQRGVANFAAEGGRHQHPDTAGNHEALLWILLDHLGIVPPGAVDLGPHRAQIARVTQGVPRVVEIVHRHAITAEDRFVMQPGFVNFQAVQRGQVLAQDQHGPVLAPSDCRVLLPLYQALGDDGYFLVTSRLIPYKRIDLAIAACNRLRARCKVVGEGRDLARLRAMAGPTIEFTGWVDEAEKRRLTAGCRAFIFPAEEDFGIAPIEATAAGKPVVAYRAGGALDTVIAGVTGTFFDEATPDSLAAALEATTSRTWVPNAIAAHAARFDTKSFKEQMRAWVSGPHEPGAIDRLPDASR